jgi:hypothetical protein
MNVWGLLRNWAYIPSGVCCGEVLQLQESVQEVSTVTCGVEHKKERQTVDGAMCDGIN